MPTVDIFQAKLQLDELIDSAAPCDVVIIAKSGIPLARLIPIAPASTPIIRKPGLIKGRIWIADDFDAPLPDDIQAAIEGK
jgi:antitoxin (DNA-binding transcriptional repressor) of toxin-antitoxin stability system